MQITRIDETKNDLILSEREAWVSFSYSIWCGLTLFVACKDLFCIFLV